MNIDDAYLKRYVSSLCIQIKHRQNPNLHGLFRSEDGSMRFYEAGDSVACLSGEAYESQRFRQLQSRYLSTITRLSLCI